ncbi:MAG: sigma factor-like helix-turn-helix DNA-binding protein [Faecousia sp.]
MLPTEKRIGRLVEVARMYYEQNMTQNEIAKKLGISRPLVSVLLAEARENGIVSIRINDISATNDELSQRIKDRFWLSSVTVVMNDAGQERQTDDLVAARAYEEFFGKKIAESRPVSVGDQSSGKWPTMPTPLREISTGEGSCFRLQFDCRRRLYAGVIEISFPLFAGLSPVLP